MKPTEKTKPCEVCQKPEGPFIRVEVRDGESTPQWLAVCGEACLQKVILHWTQICEIVRPENAPEMQEEAASPRYIVEKAERGYAIIDITGQDQPYLIDTRRPLNTYELELLTPADIKGYEALDRDLAQHWAAIWNLVEQGHCGQCRRKTSDIPGYQPRPNGEPPRHTLTLGHHMYRTLCFDCSCSLDD